MTHHYFGGKEHATNIILWDEIANKKEEKETRKEGRKKEKTERRKEKGTEKKKE
jgi:hypothetical protein